MQTIPKEKDWDYDSDNLDAAYAYEIFYDKSNEAAQEDFRLNVIERTDEIRWMPTVPLQYYIFGLRDFVLGRDWGDEAGSDAASCYINLVLEKLEEAPDVIKPVIQELMPSIKYIAQNQKSFDADEKIYGSFLDIFKKIEALI